jgi:hypothetical protein
MNKPYAWTITSCFGLAEFVSGPRGVSLSPREIQSHLNAKKFRLLDDDKEVYCEGYFVDLTPDQRCQQFEPLDDYGKPALGCTEIQYWENDLWNSL